MYKGESIGVYGGRECSYCSTVESVRGSGLCVCDGVGGLVEGWDVEGGREVEVCDALRYCSVNRATTR